MSTVPLAQIPAPHDTATLTLVDQLVQWARRRIDERVFRPGMRMPSIRKLALDKSVSRFTVVEAYERLVAQGYLDSRRGSGFYVRERAPGQQPVGASGGARGAAGGPAPPQASSRAFSVVHSIATGSCVALDSQAAPSWIVHCRRIVPTARAPRAARSPGRRAPRARPRASARCSSMRNRPI